MLCCKYSVYLSEYNTKCFGDLMRMFSRIHLCVIVIFIYNAIVILQSARTWKETQLFPADKIPENSLNPKREIVRRKIVLYHNFFRTKVRPTASNMLLMSWHTGAARQAQRYAEKCKFLIHNSNSENTLPHLGSCGQNLFVSTSKTPWFFVLKSWYLEYRNFTYGSPRYILHDVGHYTQMIWATSYKVGCGLHHCAGGPWGHFYNYVCHYCPGGNVVGISQYPYKPGTPCKDCPNHCAANALCTNSCPRKDIFSNCGELVSQSYDMCGHGYCNATCKCGDKRIYLNYPWV